MVLCHVWISDIVNKLKMWVDRPVDDIRERGNNNRNRPPDQYSVEEERKSNLLV